jgi:hypothetical protein
MMFLLLLTVKQQHIETSKFKIGRRTKEILSKNSKIPSESLKFAISQMSPKGRMSRKCFRRDRPTKIHSIRPSYEGHDGRQKSFF